MDCTQNTERFKKRYSKSGFRQDFRNRFVHTPEAFAEIVFGQGGATALGHPFAATGLRCTITCARELKRSGLRWEIASGCCGGGQGSAVLIENPDTA
jgi:acetyl-CoA acetyltransferase